MGAFAKAKLQRISADEREKPIGDPIEVQFNPTTLRLALASTNDVGPIGRPKGQYLSTGSAVLTVDLVFDTADEGTTEEAKSVLSRTTPVEQLLLPQGAVEKKQSPPKVRFEWGALVLTGIVEKMNLDLELFSEGGVPLRAKVGLSIREQKSEFEFLKSGAGANKAGNAVVPGRAGAGAVGGAGFGAGVGFGAGSGFSAGLGVGASLSANVTAGGQTAVAIGGESAAEFAARVGVDPAAWRGIAAGQIDSTLSLPAGASFDFNVGVSAGAGMGSSAGVEAGASASLEASFGLSASVRAEVSPTIALPGFALSAAGGVSAAIQAVEVIRSESAAAKTRRAFAAPPPPATAALGVAVAGASGGPRRGAASLPSAAAVVAIGSSSISSAIRPDRPDQPRAPLVATGFPSRSRQTATPPAPSPPLADARATTFGYGVPLRQRIGGAAEQRSGGLRGSIPLRQRSRGISAPVVEDPTAAPWIALHALDPVRAAADAKQARHSSRGCGCGGGCGKRGLK